MDAFRSYDRALARMSRRELLNAAWALGAAAVVQHLAGTRTVSAQSPQAFKGNPFALGVASGDPLPDGVVLWTRLAPEPLAGGGMSMTNVEVPWEMSADERFQKIVSRGSAVARPELAHSVHAEVTGLEPGRDYWYRFHAGGEASEVGRTRTAPAAGAAVDRLRFAVCGCNNYEPGYFTALRRIADEQFDFVIHTGDYIYEGGGAATVGPGRVRLHHGHECFSLDDYRSRYAQYKLDQDLRAAHLSAPFIVTSDDHEVANDYAGDYDARNTPPEVFVLRRAAAYQAYYEHMPVRATAIPAGTHMRMFRRLQFGSLVDLHLLDTRQWRSDQACGDGLRSNCGAVLDKARTMMGSEQEAWLFRNLAKPAGRWTVISQQVPTFALDRRAIDPDARFSMDKWDGYVEPRRRLYRRLRDTHAPNPIVLSGDVHQHFASELKMDFADPRSAPVGVELTNTSISSNGDGSNVSAAWPAIRADNPHVKFHSNRRGYIACTATPQRMQAAFKVLERVTVPGVPARVAGTVIVEAGRPVAELDGTE